MRRELVRCLRTVCLLSMFSSDSTTTSNVQSAFKSMISMEPDLILPSILERAVPALETLTETHRTVAIIKGLGAVSMGMVSRSMYYPGAKHIAPVLELLIPGIDLVRHPRILEQAWTQILRRMILQRLSAHPHCLRTLDSL
jgi:proteasome activator subunit 4